MQSADHRFTALQHTTLYIWHIYCTNKATDCPIKDAPLKDQQNVIFKVNLYRVEGAQLLMSLC